MMSATTVHHGQVTISAIMVVSLMARYSPTNTQNCQAMADMNANVNNAPFSSNQ